MGCMMPSAEGLQENRTEEGTLYVVFTWIGGLLASRYRLGLRQGIERSELFPLHNAPTSRRKRGPQTSVFYDLFPFFLE